MADITNVVVGACSVNFNGLDLGHTKDGVEVSYEPEYMDVSVDKYGNTVVEKKLLGEKLTAKVKLAEFTIANLRNAIPNATFAGAGNSRILIGQNAGQSQKSNAYQLVLHPLSEGTKRHDIIFYKAVVTEAVVLPHVNDAEKLVEVTFTALLDETKSAGNYLGMIGDSTT